MTPLPERIAGLVWLLHTTGRDGRLSQAKVDGDGGGLGPVADGELAQMLVTWTLAVFGLMNSCRPISRLV